MRNIEQPVDLARTAIESAGEFDLFDSGRAQSRVQFELGFAQSRNRDEAHAALQCARFLPEPVQAAGRTWRRISGSRSLSLFRS
jgi:hypothetical protein